MRGALVRRRKTTAYLFCWLKKSGVFISRRVMVLKTGSRPESTANLLETSSCPSLKPEIITADSTKALMRFFRFYRENTKLFERQTIKRNFPFYLSLSLL